MTSRPKPDVFTARASIVPKHIRLAMSSNSPSPSSSNHSGRTTPALSSGSSSHSSGSSFRSRQNLPESSPLTERTQRRSQTSHPYLGTKGPNRVLIRVAFNPDSDDESLAPSPPSFNLPRNTRPASIAHSEPPHNSYRNNSQQPHSRSPAAFSPVSFNQPHSPSPVTLESVLAAPVRKCDHLAHGHVHAHQHSGSVPQSTRNSARGLDDRALDRRGGHGGGGVGSNRAPSAPGEPAHGGTGRGHEGDDGDDCTGNDASDDEPDYGGVGSAYNDAWAHPKLEMTGRLQARRHHDLSKAFNGIVLPYFVGRCAPCAVRGLEHDHGLDDCKYGFGCSDQEPAYAAWHYKSLTLPDRKWCTYCIMALPSGGGWHPEGFGRRCAYPQIIKPALWTLFTQHAPAPHISTSDLVPPALFEDDTPGLYALCEWAQTPVKAQPGILNLHVLLLWVFDLIGVLQIPESCRPLVTELAAQTAQFESDAV
ncbi:hypothetical protein B0H10DRAFT_2245680 [Mycena sp. CBHHK59/15]|nr:hypothetical protein B0H10DRAFT_2245680 [Mycena sp. CBHHK59/15]